VRGKKDPEEIRRGEEDDSSKRDWKWEKRLEEGSFT